MDLAASFGVEIVIVASRYGRPGERYRLKKRVILNLIVASCTPVVGIPLITSVE